ncbi:hypothetical protein EDB81DRAFT_131332 [Dactylonectria macrodidyma]|uniref:Rhodopsin domain-containing protein n=1 Tax=Dactylonectria macrodidyma TaxID=307937 RepID=A0A9P9E5I5_9HYPO|nr:hypothetical protein EDB81DRAFT_131332 [Dactylonectria macrodidyma]
MLFIRALGMVLSFSSCIFPIVLAQVTAQDLPACARKCFTALPQNASSSGCSLTPGSNFENTFSPCFYARCSTRAALSALNITSIICDEPVRDISQAIRIYVIVATVFASVVIGLRVLVKFKGLAGGIGLDDWAIVVSVGLTMIATVGQFLGAWYGLGRDEWKLDENAHRWVLKSFYIAAIGYKLANSGCRVSLLCFYLRIFGTSAFRRAVVALISLNVTIGITFALADALQCRPPAAFWRDWTREHGSRCASLSAISWSHAILNIIMDIATLAMAVWMVRGLKMRWRKKASVVGMFALGSAITIVSIVRVQSLIPLSRRRNMTWNLAPVSYWSGIEMLAGLVCACLPAMKALSRVFCGARKNGSQSTSTGYQRALSPGPPPRPPTRAEILYPSRVALGQSSASGRRTGTDGHESAVELVGVSSSRFSK